VWLGDTEVTALRGEALAAYRARRVGFVFQDHHLLPQLTALENVLVPTLAAGRPGADAEGRASDLLAAVGLSGRAASLPARLSGGECQRVAVARALVSQPDLLLCDEPTGNLDADNGHAVMALLTELARTQGTTLLVVTHNAEHAAALDRRLELRAGALRPVQRAPGGSP
jgi:predicted ABC-type transport system involved in lysophospholipase L1 biosynthesis ATPase subunit